MLADCAFFREAQEKISTLNNTAMVVTMDVGEAKDLHPQNKKPIGIRLAKTALHETYNRLDVLYQGPQFDYASFNRNKVIVHFDAGTVVAGLQTNDGKSPAHFMVAGADRMFFPAEAVIDNNTVIVWSAKVKRPVAVRYAFTNYPVTNLENKNKFPVLPFRSDNWPEKNN
jgi:sialate O-acetylesterase